MIRSLKRKMLKGSLSGITISALLGAGAVFGSSVLAADTHVKAVSESEKDIITETTDVAIYVNNAAESTKITENAEISEENPEKHPEHDDAKGQISGVSAVDANNSRDVLQESMQAATDDESLKHNKEKKTSEDEYAKGGWIYEDGGYKYYKNGEFYTGWHYMGAVEGEKISHWSYFSKEGSLYSGWHYMSKNEGERTPHWSYFGANGWLRTDWVQMGKGTAEPDGNTQKHWSYFGINGWLRTGLQTMGTSANPDGNSKLHLSYFGGDGWLVENKTFNLNNKQYIADAKGWVTEAKSEHEKVLAKARLLVDKLTDSNMGKREKLLKCYQYIQVSDFKNPWIPHYTGTDWPQKYAGSWFDTRSGNCFSYAASLGYVAKVLGYESVYCCNGKIHGWAEIDGLIYDTSENCRGISYDTKSFYDYKGLISKGEPWMRVKL